MFDDQTEPQHVPKFLLQESVREPHNILVSDPNDGGIKYARDEDGVDPGVIIYTWNYPR